MTVSVNVLSFRECILMECFFKMLLIMVKTEGYAVLGKWLVQYKDIKFGNELGAGSFGTVYRGMSRVFY